MHKNRKILASQDIILIFPYEIKNLVPPCQNHFSWSIKWSTPAFTFDSPAQDECIKCGNYT